MIKIVSIVAVLALLGGSAYLVSTTSNNDEQTTSNQEAQSLIPETDSIPILDTGEDKEAQEPLIGGVYVDYESGEFLRSISDVKTVVFFHADWCSNCRFFENDIESNGVPENVRIVKVDYDKEASLRNIYGVTVQSTFVLLDSNGSVAEDWPFARGLSSINDLYEQI